MRGRSPKGVDMLNRMLSETVKKYPQKTALVYGKSRMDYRELYTKVVGLSKGLDSIGIKESHPIALILPNCPEFLISFFAAAKLNALILPLNPMFKEDELRYYISDSDAKVIITDTNRADICHHILSQSEGKTDLITVDGVHPSSIYFYDLIREEIGDYENDTLFEGDLLYQYSSGSTGRPKRVGRTQKNLFHEADNFTTTTKITSSDNILCIVPLFHAHGLGNCLLAASRTGATLIILEKFIRNGSALELPFIFRLPRVLELIEGQKVTLLPGVPYTFSALAEASQKIQVDLSALRLCFSAGSSLSKETFDKFIKRYSIPIKQLYGCTEAGSLSINLATGPQIKYDSVGLPIKNVEIKIMDDKGNELPPNSIGEIAIKSQAMAEEYHNMPNLNKEVFKHGFFFTGDLGKKDEKGYLYITGRKKLFIDAGGHKVDPLEIEDILNIHPKIKEAVVVGVKGPHEGEIVKAVVVLREEECKKHEILSYCKERLAEFKIPKIIEFRQEIPRSPLGKILRKDLI